MRGFRNPGSVLLWPWCGSCNGAWTLDAVTRVRIQENTYENHRHSNP
ncbi:hypothetical protein [Oligoflexus tunisiensis]|nr:hypothetical protein [Oligoflexus tunisiensis]